MPLFSLKGDCDVVKKDGVIVLEQRMVKSKSWLSLGATAKDVFLLLRCKCRVGRTPGKPGKRSRERIVVNDGEITFTYREAKERYEISESRFRRAIDELLAKGFIRVTKTGMGLFKCTTFYGLSEGWRTWQPGDPDTGERPKPNVPHRGFQPGNCLGARAEHDFSSAEIAHDAVGEIAHGDVIAMRTDAHGRRITICYKFRGRRWLASKIA